MKKISFLVLLISLFILSSCNSDLLMNNGENMNVDSPSDSKSDVNNSIQFSTEAPKSVTATTSFFQDKIVIRWNSVKGADYYSVEKTSHDNEEIDENAVWKTIPQSFSGNSYEDKVDLKAGKYYSYRVTAHTLDGNYGDCSEPVTGTILSSPINFDASKGSDSKYIYLSWDLMPNVQTYNIYKSIYNNTVGEDNELVAEVTTNTDKGNYVYSYLVEDESEKGKELYFVIKAVGETGEKAKASNPRFGYTRVLGAPQKPMIENITKGSSTSEINVDFYITGDYENINIVTSKSINGGSETIIYNSANEGNMSTLSDLGNGHFRLTDTYVSENLRYNYSIYAYNDIGKSEAVNADAYILSSVQDLELIAINNDSKFGYSLVANWPIGYDDEERINSGVSFYYNITKLTKNGFIYEEYDISEDNFFNDQYLFFPVLNEPTKEDEGEEIQRVDVYITAKKNGEVVASSKTVSSNVLSKLSTPIKELKIISNAIPLPEDIPNSEGVYPLHISWTTDTSLGGEESTIFKLVKLGTDGSKAIIDLLPGMYLKNGNEYSYTDKNISSPLVLYTYYIDTTDELGRTLGELKIQKDCYPAVTGETYAYMFGSLVLKPWDLSKYVPAEYRNYWKNCRIATLIGYGNASDLSTQMKALDTATDVDHFRSGKVNYSAKLEGVKGSIDFTYENFGESPYFYGSGHYHMLCDSSGDGKSSTNTNGFTIKGVYPGRISIEEITIKKKGFYGNYILYMQRNDSNGNPVEVMEKVWSK